MKNALIRFALYTIIALVPVGCGTRKVDLDKQSVFVKDESKIDKEDLRETVKIISTQNEAFNQNDKSNETTETIETAKYDKDTGKQTEYSKTTKTGKEIDKSITKTKTITNRIFHDVEKLKTVTITKHTYDADSKKKSTSADRNGLYYLYAFGLLILGVLAWLKWVRK